LTFNDAIALIWRQWAENLALRRVYYLEFNHYKGRKAELEILANLTDPEDPMQDDRPPYVPQPELRDTIPNIGLYSVLYKLPPHHYPSVGNVTASQVGRQLSSAVDFFDRVVPNQPGYSSSVAAVTILPDAKQLARAWKKWYQCAKKLRRLRYIRRRLRRLREGQDPQVQIVFESGDTSPMRAGSLNESLRSNSDQNESFRSNGDHIEKHMNGGERDVTVDQSISDIPGSPSRDTSPEHKSNSQKGNNQSPTSSSGLGSNKENIQDVAAPTRSTTPGGLLETVDEGSISDSNSEYSCPAEPLGEFDIEAKRSSVKRSSRRKRIDRSLLSDNDRLVSTLSSASSEYGDDFEEHRSIAPYPNGASNLSHRSNNTLDNSNGRNLTGSPVNSALRHRFLSSIGLHEESKLEHFLSDDDIEQLTIYCQEFARR
jgi:hypothetical protein